MEPPIILHKISSQNTFFMKSVLPMILICVYMLISFVILNIAMVDSGNKLWLFIGLIVLGLVIYVIWRALIMDLADEVFDCGEYLLIRKDGEEIRVKLEKISRFYYSYLSNPPYVLLSVSESRRGRDEKQYQFDVPKAWSLTKPDHEIKALEKRIKQARESC